jgi:hypothetical protein
LARSPLILIASVALLGCGRLGFDATSDAGLLQPPLEAQVTRFSTTSDTFVEVPGGSLTIPPSPGVHWLILVSASIQSSTFGEVAVEARYLVDGVERGIGGTQQSEVDRPGPWQHFYVHPGTASPALVTVELHELTGGTSTINDLHLVAIPLPAAADPLYGSVDAIANVTGEPVHVFYDFALDPDRAGDYLFLLLANTSDRPVESDNTTRWLDPAGQPWTQFLQMPRTPWQSHLYVRGATLGPDSITIRFEAVSPGGQTQYVRLLAVRTDAFASFALATDQLERATTAPAVTVTSSVSPNAAGAHGYLFLGSARVQDDCANTVPADRGIQFAIDGAITTLRHATQNCAYMTTYGTVRLLPAATSTASVGFDSGNGQIVNYKESSLLLLGLD